ncbi:RT RNaseH 2 domain-containing protein [Abeliophyllum distichum]|uniref:RT RNaseH 2 domain-containing protein n=1 Tax=Abeliophyllum distichum TaxID=126358 RepID=A0ABD1TZS0_9LAMI
MAALSRFISKAMDKCLPFFKVLKGSKRVQWMTECETAFQALKEHLGHAPYYQNPRQASPCYCTLLCLRSLSRGTLPRYGETRAITHYGLKEIEALLLSAQYPCPLQLPFETSYAKDRGLGKATKMDY